MCVCVYRGGGDNRVVITAAQVEAWQGATGRNVMAKNSQKGSIHSISTVNVLELYIVMYTCPDFCGCVPA